METITTNGLTLINQNYNPIAAVATTSSSTFDASRSSLTQNNLNSIHCWPTSKKVELLSSFSRCSIPLCVCTGWKHEQSTLLNGDDITTTDEQSKKLDCAACQHSFDCHSNRWLNASEQQIEHGIQLLLDADWLITMGASNEHDLATNRIILFTAQILHNTIGDPFNYNVSIGLGNLIGSPPFEHPTILTAAINFVAYQYTKAVENEIQIIFEAAKHFLQLINTWKMPSIVSYMLSKQKTEQLSTNNNNNNKIMMTMKKNDETMLTPLSTNGDESQPSCSSSSSFSRTTSTKKQLDNREYELWYARWTSYCILPQICNKTLIKYDCINIFGLTYMRYIYEQFKFEILKRNEQRQLFSSLIFQNFIDLFEQSLDETSPSHCCWNKYYERPIIPIEAEIYTFTQANQQSLSSGNSSHSILSLPTSVSTTTTTPTTTTTTIKYEPEKKVTRRVSKALTNKRRLGTPASSSLTINNQLLTSSLSSIGSYHPYSNEFVRKIWSNVKEQHQKRIQSEIEKTLYKANPKRDEVARLAEQRGFAEFHLIKHNLQTLTTTNETDIMYKRLLQLINVFSRALPKMPQNYITRTVLDPRHQSLVIIFASKVIGGITYRMFQHRNFTEIVFCAVSEYQQVRGYGTHLMNHLKDYHIKKNIKHLLTYADGFAVGYFKKQGFSSTITLNETVYLGYIKDYDGATLMQCDLYDDICYTKLTETFTLIKDCLHTLKLYKQQELLQSYGEEYGAKFVLDDDDSSENMEDRKQIIPNVLSNGQNDEEIDVLYITLNGVYKEIRQHPNSTYVQRLKLHSSSTNDNTMLYPIDLDSIQERLKSQYYRNSYTFIADMSRLLHLSRYIYEQKKEDQDIKLFDAFVRRKMNEFGLEMPNNTIQP
ncbi:unnamed protein product [Didymodactylos carnosus]|uniref:N-acetyltransferase domain-containing protein n=1 Tax=Didymodactylos carnosus TaxID=1234261 RepID=A0A814LTF8_9BILA|nr:unnamed protein product [Didymodactylos carnosus]CAF1070644.1 unnamed protein product [Didymodactylos carnosus]CAF3656046.1 unnamed protein product [Didymodactylos carnosus]CAF3837700.1 unnamed protein product [Didymodactylos carnosus]